MFEQDYFAFSSNLKFFDYINPINIEGEKSNFFNALSKSKAYNPTFQYRNINFKRSFVLEKLKQFREYFRSQQSYEGDQFCKLIDHQVEWINQVCNRNQSDFIKWLSSLYSKPSKEKLDFAVKTIKILKPINDSERLKPTEAKNRMDQELKKRDYCNWHTSISSDIAAKIYVDSNTNQIIINEHRTFSQRELDRLIVHEIDTHVLRHENGKKQKSLIYAYGLPAYIETEEGLAIYSEFRTKLLSDLDLSKYCARLIASYYTYELSFHDLYQVVNQYIEQDLAFDITVRVKRGLKNTIDKGGFTKDQVYFSGFNLIKKLKVEDIKLLYIGKVGIEHIKNIPDIKEKLERDCDIPLWISDHEKNTPHNNT